MSFKFLEKFIGKEEKVEDEKETTVVTDEEAKEIEKGKEDIKELEKTAEKIMGGGEASSETQETDVDKRTDFSESEKKDVDESNKEKRE